MNEKTKPVGVSKPYKTVRDIREKLAREKLDRAQRLAKKSRCQLPN